MSGAKSPEVVDGMIDDSLLGILLILLVVMLSTGYVYIQQLQQGDGARGGAQQGLGRRAPAAAAAAAATTGSSRAMVSTAGLTEQQLRLHYALPQRHGARTVTVCMEALLKDVTAGALAWKSEDIPEALADLARIADVYLLCTVADAKDTQTMQRIRDFVAQNPDLKSSEGASAAGDSLPKPAGGIKAHKILFCTTSIGKIAFVRQIEPQIHVEVASGVARDLEKHVARIVYVASSPSDAVVPSVPNVIHVADSFAVYFKLLSAAK